MFMDYFTLLPNKNKTNWSKMVYPKTSLASQGLQDRQLKPKPSHIYGVFLAVYNITEDI